MNEFILYSYFRSSASFRVRIALGLKGLKYEYRAIHLLKDDQSSEGYAKLNPSRQVPALIHNGKTIGQSMAIIDYLDHIKPAPALFPADPFQRALVIQACEIINSGAQPLHNLSVLNELEKRFGADQVAKDVWTVHWIQRSLEALETLISPHSGSFSFSSSASAADCFLIPHLANADRYHISLTPYQTLSRVQKHCQSIGAFKLAAPNVQPDAPPA